MEKEEFEQYIDSVKNNPKVQEILEFTKINDFGLESIHQNIEAYLNKYFFTSKFVEKFKYEKKPNYQFLKDFLDSVIAEKNTGIIFTEKGLIDLSKPCYLRQAYSVTYDRGQFFDGWIKFSNGQEFMSKHNMAVNNKNSGYWKTDCIYNSCIAAGIAKQLGIETAKYYIATLKPESVNPWDLRIITPNFLEKNEELITIGNDDDFIGKNNYISSTLQEIEQQLTNRRFSKTEIEKVKIDFLKQEFLAKIIGLKDQKPSNSPVIISIDEDNNKHVKMTPMLDYDYSFHIAEEINYTVRKCDNEETNIQSFIEQYKDNTELQEFIKQSLDIFSMPNVFRTIFEETGMPEFGNFEESEILMKFLNFANKNIEKARKAFYEIHNEKLQRGEIK